MTRWRSAWLSGVLLVSAPLIANTQDAAARPPATCPVTKPPFPPFVAPSPYPPSAPYGGFWLGTDDFWTMIYPGGTWQLPHKPGSITQKIFWWRPGFDGRVENYPALFVTGKRLDAPAAAILASRATNAYHADFGGWAMLTGVDIPTAGCWEIAGRHRGREVRFVVWVVP